MAKLYKNRRSAVICGKHGKPMVRPPWGAGYERGRYNPAQALVCIDCVRADRERLHRAVGRLRLG